MIVTIDDKAGVVIVRDGAHEQTAAHLMAAYVPAECAHWDDPSFGIDWPMKTGVI